MSEPIIKEFSTIAELYAAMGLELTQDGEFTIHTLEGTHRPVPMKSPPFRAGYYSFLFIREGRGRYFLDGRDFDCGPRTIYFTNPGHVKGFEALEQYHGYILTMSENFLKQFVHADLFAEFPFLLAEIVPPNYTDEEVFNGFASLCDSLYQAYHRPGKFREEILGKFMAILLYEIKEKFWSEYNPEETSDRSASIVLNFKRDLEEHFKKFLAGGREEMPAVKDFAAMQGLHPNHLSTVLKSRTGKAARDWISDKLLVEAQGLLARTNLSIGEIAEKLAFGDPAHFSKFMKNRTGQSPRDFRAGARE